jgi:hypothetical protein
VTTPLAVSTNRRDDGAFALVIFSGLNELVPVEPPVQRESSSEDQQ